MSYLLLAAIVAQFVLFWLYVREDKQRAAREREKLLDRLQTGSAEKAALIERQEGGIKQPSPRLTADLPSVDGVEFTGKGG